MPRKAVTSAAAAAEDEVTKQLKRFRREAEGGAASSDASAAAAAAPSTPKRRKIAASEADASAAASASATSTGADAGGSSSSSANAAYPAPEMPPALYSPSRGFGKPIDPPPEWREQLAAIRSMRAAGGAPVDTMGCERCADPTAPPAVYRYQTLVSLMLSSQTRDEITHAAMMRLRAHGLTPQHIADTDQAVLAELIKPVGFWRLKAGYLKETTAKLLAEYGGDIPNSVVGLTSLKGVGPKMAFIAMAAAWNKPVGIGVDTHVHRISNRLRWVKTEEPEATRQHLQSWLPREDWADINVLFVGFGQTVCTPLKPKCSECKCAAICPASTAKPRKAAGGAGSEAAAATEEDTAAAAAAAAAAASSLSPSTGRKKDPLDW